MQRFADSLVVRSHPNRVVGRRAFSLVEMLVVISILGLLAALTVPALKNLNKSNLSISASRQLLDDAGRARQMAIANRTYVYMVFVPTNFWSNINFNKLTPAQQTLITNLIPMQLSGYAMVSYGKLGDQPGRHSWKYLTDWKSLPENSYLAPFKFVLTGQPTRYTVGSDNDVTVYQFDRTNGIPFPTEDTDPLANYPALPYIAFDYTGQLISSYFDTDRAGNGAVLPLVQGQVAYGYNGTTKQPVLTAVNPSDISEVPAGNSTNIAYNLIHVDPLTGRAAQQFFKLK
ncbi:MAG TPA: prepilin-type N-terminal cleavage/methylation domain-containing protein [Verrucomicrobiae bacterium]